MLTDNFDLDLLDDWVPEDNDAHDLNEQLDESNVVLPLDFN